MDAQCDCGSTNFFVDESILWNAASDAEHSLLIMASKPIGNEVERITCRDCGNELKEQFDAAGIEVQFNG